MIPYCISGSSENKRVVLKAKPWYIYIFIVSKRNSCWVLTVI